MHFSRRAIIIVLDSVGIGALPDAADYGDAGTNTLAHVAEAVGGLRLPNLAAMGLGNIGAIAGVALVKDPNASFGKMAELSAGKDTTTGHWEMMGVVTRRPFPTYPNGFPEEIIREFERRIGRGTLGNKVASGTEIIKQLGEEHIRTGCPIVYTSADSVFQIAAHEEVVPVDELYEMCLIARGMLVEPHNVQRVIARPFVGKPGAFARTPRRRDFALQPPSDTLLDKITSAGGEVIGIGKIEDIFCGRGITRAIHTGSNAEGIEATITEIEAGAGDVIFANLVDFDMLWGHRNDARGYADALEDFDRSLPSILDALKTDDVLIITADHGCDPTTPGTDHTREYVPLLVYGPSLARGVNLGTRGSFCDVAATLAEWLGVGKLNCGESFAGDVLGVE